MTDLFLVRHAIAGTRVRGPRDDARGLTDEGRHRFVAVVRGLERMGVAFDRIVHSPLRRACETAELLVPLLDGTTQADPRLATSVEASLLPILEGGSVCAVGHEPYIGQLAALLVVGKTGLAEHFPFKKGGVVWLRGDVEPGGMQLLAAFPPKAFRS